LKILVCIKRVPDTEARIRIADGGAAIDSAGIKYIISPYDEFALETALRLKEAAASGEVVAMTLGPAAASEQIRTALAMGADRAVLLKGEPSLDGLATAHALAAAIREEAPDLVLLGMKAADDDQQQVGPMLAHLLDFPCIAVVSQIEASGDGIVAHREVEGGVEIVEAALPAVVTITKGAYEPRYPSLKGIMAAKKKPVVEKDAQLGDSRVRVKSLVPPPDRPQGRIVGEGADAVPELVRLLREEAKVL
jgi:electron transfer flavoprotein beta subunit